jgi:transcriptional regulator with XRE-family HTH domain
MSDDLSSRFWERVDSIRTISLKELAEAIQVDYNVMIAQKAMNRIPRIDELCRYAHALSTSLEWLVSGRESETLFAGNLLANLDSRLSTIINAVIQADSEVLSEIERILNI